MDERLPKVEKLRMEAGQLMRKANEIEEDIRNDIQRPILRDMVGKSFVYQNAGGGSIEGRWTLYMKVVSFDEKKMTFVTVQFQRYKISPISSRVEIETRREYNFNGHNRFGVENGWEPIATTVYNKARAEMLVFVQEQFKK